MAGASVGIGASNGTYDENGNGGEVGAGVSVGAQVGAEVGGGATMDDGVATIGVDGEVALLAGVDVDLSVSVDTKPAQEAVVDTSNTVVKETTKVVDKVAEPVKDAGNTVVGGAKDVGKKMKKWF
jgi:hypothetical protein